jgi:hypothetical protein
MGSGAQMVLHPFEHGWLAQEILSEQERDRGMHLGQGSYVIDRTGVVTVHSSLPMPVVIAQYTEGRREGRIPGRQVWPEPTTTAQ